jgi:hypothetical protein
MKEVEPPDLAAVLDRARPDAQRRELRAGHHVLPNRQSGDRNVGCGHSVGIVSTR